jgi:dTDP-4-amino-4,6-dideoxygalactose transaminase
VSKPIAITEVVTTEAEERLVLEVLRSGQLAQGPMVARLEEAFCEVAGTSSAVAVTSGTTALVASLEALRLEPGDEVITSPLTFAATLNSILEAGAVARFADIGDDYSLDPDSAAALIGSRTRAIMPVHLYGMPAPMAAIMGLAESNGLAVVEDAAQAIGATYQGRPVGSFGIGCFSLYATKNITTGEGGMITTNDPGVAARLRSLRNQGMAAKYEYVMAGHNYRMTDLQAAVGVAQIQRLPEITERRQKNAAALSAGLAGTPGLRLPAVAPERTHVFHQYTVRLTGDTPREELASQLANRGIGTGVYYPRVVYDYEVYRHHPRVQCDPVPNAQRAAGQVLSLPVHPGLSRHDLERIVREVRRALGASD